MSDNLLNKLINDGFILDQKSVAQYESVLKHQYTIAFKEINQQLKDLYLKYGDPPPIKELYKFNRLKNMELRIAEILKDRYKSSRSIISQAIKNSLDNGFYTQGWAWKEWGKGAGLNINFGLFNPTDVLATELAQKLPLSNPLSREKITGYIFKQRDGNGNWIWEKSLKDLNAKVYTKVNNSITQGVIQGKNYRVTARELKNEIFGKEDRGFNVNRALERIVRTETNKARSLGELVNYNELKYHARNVGVKIQRLWNATLDDRVRGDHLSLHNQPEDENEQWSIGGLVTNGPHQFGVAREDINCRCRIIHQTEGLESSYDESAVAKRMDPKRYEIWKQNQKKLKKGGLKKDIDVKKT